MTPQIIDKLSEAYANHQQLTDRISHLTKRIDEFANEIEKRKAIIAGLEGEEAEHTPAEAAKHGRKIATAKAELESLLKAQNAVIAERRPIKDERNRLGFDLAELERNLKDDLEQQELGKRTYESLFRAFMFSQGCPDTYKPTELGQYIGSCLSQMPELMNPLAELREEYVQAIRSGKEEARCKATHADVA